MKIHACLAKWMPTTALLAVLLAGCIEGRKSLHEMDHVQPPHWPANLRDAADKIAERMAWLDGANPGTVTGSSDVAATGSSDDSSDDSSDAAATRAQAAPQRAAAAQPSAGPPSAVPPSAVPPDRTQVLRELAELVDWAPEVAADTDLTEDQWMPIYTAARALHQRIGNANTLNPATRNQLLQLIDKLREAHDLLPPDAAYEPDTDAPIADAVGADAVGGNAP
jgi:hypothetical protein